MLQQSCTYQYVECSRDMLPMISDVICLPLYDRVFCILATFFCLATYQADVRAFYKKLYGIASDSQNDWLLVLGLISTVTLPMIGYFDEHTYSTVHGISAVLFFLSVGVYAWILSNVLNANKDKFPVEEHESIDRLNHMKRIMWISLLSFMFSMIFGGNNFWLTPFAEWTSTLLFVNYFGLLSMTNKFYDSVAEYNLTPPVTI